MRIFFKKYLLDFFIFLLFFYISFLRLDFHEGFTVAGGDFYQLIDANQHVQRYFYSWINQIGQGAYNTLSVAFPYYWVMSILRSIFGSEAAVLHSQVFFILYLSYIGFFASVKYVFPKIPETTRRGAALIYALNSFTFTFFTYSWGFTHHVLFYIFIPPLLFLFIRIFSGKEEFLKREIALYALIFIFSTPAYNNIAFFVALILIQMMILLFLGMSGCLAWNSVLFKKVFSFSLLYLLISFYFLTPFYISSIDFSSKLSEGSSYGNDVFGFIEKNSNTVLGVFQMDVNAFNSSKSLLNVIYPLTVFFLFYSWLMKKKEDRGLVLLAISIILLLVVVAVRINEPFVGINSFLFQTKIFLLFRSPDKVFFFMPFFYVFLLTALLNSLRFRKEGGLLLIFFLLLIIPFGFYDGRIQDELFRLTGKGDEKYRYIVSVPDEYYRVQEIVNDGDDEAGIISLPYSVVNSLNWSNYPKWHFVGHDILHLLYGKRYISANTYDHPGYETTLSFKEFQKGNGTPEELLNLIRKFSGRFIFLHKDISSRWISDMRYVSEVLQILDREGKVRLVDSNDLFDLYRLDNDYFIPTVHSLSDTSFRMINPSKYHVRIRLDEIRSMTFHQSFHSQWRVYGLKKEQYLDRYGGLTGALKEIGFLWKDDYLRSSHEMVDEYANQWTLDPEYIKNTFPPGSWEENPDGSLNVFLTLYYRPQAFFYLGLLITGITATGCLGYLGYDFWRERRRKKNLVCRTEE